MFFKPKEIKWARAALDARIQRDVALGGEMEIIAGVRELIDKPDWSVDYIRNKGLSPEVFVAFLLSEMIGRLLSSGTLHVYRGLLSARGKWLHEYYDELVNELVRNRFYDEDDGDYWKGWLDEEISQVG